VSAAEPANAPRAPERPLENGWLADTPVGDSLQRRFVLGFAEWIESSGLAAGHPVLRTDDLVAVDEHSAHLLLNSGILLHPLAAADVGRVLGDVLGLYAGGAGGPFSVFSPWPTELPDLEVGGHPPLMLRLPAPAAPPVPDGLEVVEVTTPDLLAEYERVLVEGFPLDELQPWQASVALHPSSLHVPGVRMFVGLDDGRGTCGATSIVAHGVNHVEWVATLPEARGRGCGAAVTWAATLAAPDVPAMLIASEMGRPVYERMGYVVLDRWTLFVGQR
jgi:hypothetical protein